MSEEIETEPAEESGAANDEAVERDRDAHFSDRPTGATKEPCPIVKSICGRFDPALVKCGSAVSLQAETTNISDGLNAQFAMRSLPGQGAVGSESAPISGSQIRGLNWISKKPTDQWPEAGEMDFEVAADGVSAESENKLKFHKYVKIPWQLKSYRRTSGIYGWDAKYLIMFEDGLVHIVVKIKILNMQGPRPASGSPEPAVGAALTAAEKRTIERDIRSYLTGKWLLHRKDCLRLDCDCPKERQCCKFRIRVWPRLVESGEHHVVRLYTGTGQAKSTQWFRVKSWPTSYGHEVGHLLGFYDEYEGGATGPSPWRVRGGVLMSSDGPRFPKYYYNDINDWFKQKTGEDWECVAR